MSDYAGKRAVITGGTSGIGLATARVLVAGRARVLVTGRTPSSIETARAVLGPDAVVLASDAVTGIDGLAERAAAELGAVDLLVLNAGITAAAAVEDTDAQTYDELFAVNTRAPFFTLQRFLPLLPSGSAVVLTTSVSNAKGIATTSVYSATKAALRSMTRTFARELIDRGIRVNAVSPGPIDTPGITGLVGEDEASAFKAAEAATLPIRRMGRPEEVAAAIAFLASDQSSFIVGANLYVDGGGNQV